MDFHLFNRIRRVAGIPQVDLARRLGISKSHLNNVLAGRFRPSPSLLESMQSIAPEVEAQARAFAAEVLGYGQE